MSEENPLNSEDPQDQPLYEIEEGLRHDPLNPHLLTEAVRHYHRLAMQGNDASLDKATGTVKALLELDPRNVEAMAISGSLHTIMARRTTSLFKRIWYSFKAARVLDKAVKLDPKNVSARTIRAFTALVLPRYQKRLPTAVGDFEYLLQVKSEDPAALPDEMMPKVYFNLGFANVKMGDFERAREILSVVIARFPESRECARAQSLLHKIGDET